MIFLEGVVVTVFGLLFGSFLNVLILRIPKEESIVFPGSHCFKCNKNKRRGRQAKLVSFYKVKILAW